MEICTLAFMPCKLSRIQNLMKLEDKIDRSKIKLVKGVLTFSAEMKQNVFFSVTVEEKTQIVCQLFTL